MEREKDGSLPMLNMCIFNENCHLSSTSHSKPSATGLIMNFHALAPMKYKRAVVTSFVHRVYRACSDWKNVHDSLERAKVILKMNQYPPDFYEPIIRDTVTRIFSQEKKREADENSEKPYLIFLEYRGKCSESYARDIRQLCTSNAVTSDSCKMIFTLRKLKTVLPSLKEPVEKRLRSGLVYKITCSHCEMCYVGKKTFRYS